MMLSIAFYRVHRQRRGPTAIHLRIHRIVSATLYTTLNTNSPSASLNAESNKWRFKRLRVPGCGAQCTCIGAFDNNR